MSSVLLVGASSYIASHFRLKYSSCSSFVIVSATSSPQSFTDLILNLAEPSSFDNLLKYSSFDFALIFSSITKIRDCENTPSFSRFVNYESTSLLISRLIESGTRVVFLSSSAVFSNASIDHYEDSVVEPETTYGRLKLMVESEFLSSSFFHAARLTKVISPIDFVGSSLLKLRHFTPVEAFNDVFVAPLSIVDAVEHLGSVLASYAPGISHLTTDKYIDYFNLIKKLAFLCGLDSTLVTPSDISFTSTVSNSLRQSNPVLYASKSSSKSIDLLSSLENIARQFIS